MKYEHALYGRTHFMDRFVVISIVALGRLFPFFNKSPRKLGLYIPSTPLLGSSVRQIRPRSFEP